jgi:hypothetical protein
LTTKTWIIECDRCARIIDATKESFLQDNGEDVCKSCYSEKDFTCVKPVFRLNWKHGILIAVLCIAFILCCSVMGYFAEKLILGR